MNHLHSVTRTALLLPALIVLGMLAGCAGRSHPPSSAALDDVQVDIAFRRDGELRFYREAASPLATIAIEIADTDSARTRGLMQRNGLPTDSGMLFVFPEESRRSFWMANTRIGLDMIFVASDSTIVDIAKYVRPMSSSSTVSRAPARFVIEVAAGYTDARGIVETDRVSWRRD